MSRIAETTVRFSRTLGVIITLLAMLFVSSAQGAFEECSEESASQEIELVVGRRDVQQIEAQQKVVYRTRLASLVSKMAKPSQPSCIVVVTERSSMNGSGTFLLI